MIIKIEVKGDLWGVLLGWLTDEDVLPSLAKTNEESYELKMVDLEKVRYFNALNSGEEKIPTKEYLERMEKKAKDEKFVLLGIEFVYTLISKGDKGKEMLRELFRASGVSRWLLCGCSVCYQTPGLRRTYYALLVCEMREEEDKSPKFIFSFADIENKNTPPPTISANFKTPVVII